MDTTEVHCSQHLAGVEPRHENLTDSIKGMLNVTTYTQNESHHPVMEVKGLSGGPGDTLLFKDLDLSLPPGISALLGDEGSGKTSLLRLLTGLTSPESGEVLWSGRSIKKEASEYHDKLLFLGHRDALKEDLSAIENLRLYAAIDGIALSDRDAFASLWRFGLKGREDLPVNCLSAGRVIFI